MHSFSLFLLFGSELILHSCISICDFYYIKIVATLVFILFVALIFNMYIKLINFFIHIFFIFFRIIFRIYHFNLSIYHINFSHLVVFFPLVIILFWCVSVNILRVLSLFFTNCNDYNLSKGSAFLRVHTDIDKDGDCLQSNNKNSLNDLWLFFATLFFFS